MDPAFELAFNPARHAVLRLPLKPLTLGHVFLLQRFHSPFLTGAEVTLFQLVLSVFICAGPWREAEKALRSHIRLWLWMRYWGFRTRKCDLLEECAKFDAYISESFVIPSFKIDLGRNEQPELSSPAAFRLLGRLTKEFHFTRDEALDTPILEATAILVADAEVRGQVKFWTSTERDLIEAFKASKLEAKRN